MTTSRIGPRIGRSSDIGRLIVEGRKRANLSQAEFAERLGVSRKTISDIERGAAAHISLHTALAALWMAGFQLEAHKRRPPTLSDVMARRAEDLIKAAQTPAPEIAATKKSTRRT